MEWFLDFMDLRQTSRSTTQLGNNPSSRQTRVHHITPLSSGADLERLSLPLTGIRYEGDPKTDFKDPEYHACDQRIIKM